MRSPDAFMLLPDVYMRFLDVLVLFPGVCMRLPNVCVPSTGVHILLPDACVHLRGAFLRPVIAPTHLRCASLHLHGASLHLHGAHAHSVCAYVQMKGATLHPLARNYIPPRHSCLSFLHIRITFPVPLCSFSSLVPGLFFPRNPPDFGTGKETFFNLSGKFLKSSSILFSLNSF